MNQTLIFSVETNILVHILLLGTLGFLLSMLITPIYTTAAYKWQWWKKPRMTAATGEAAKVFARLHHEKHQR